MYTLKLRSGRTLGLLLLGAIAVGASVATRSQTPARGNWPQYRGANAAGIAEGYPLPVKWNADTSDNAPMENILWKTPIPGLGHSSPIVWGDRVFITTAVTGKEKAELKVGLYGEIDPVQDDTAHQFKVYCLNKRTGKVLWERTAAKGVPKVKRHTKSTHANPTMATDGKYVVASFGSEGLYCYDMDGKPIWKTNLGLLDSGYYMVPSAQWGFASSPILYKQMVIVQCDIQKDGFLAALNLKTGKQIWRTRRTDVPTWGTPTLLTQGGRAQIVVNGWKQIGGYDAETGLNLWKMEGGGDIPVPTPVIGHGLVFICNAHGRSAPMYAIRPDATGNISLKGAETTNTYIAWSTQRNGAYMQTPLVYGDYLYSSRDNGVVTCYNARTGETLYQERMGTGRTGFTASPVAGDGKIYFTSELGDIYVVKAGPKFELIGTNTLGEICMASPAISEGTLFFRTQGHLVAVQQK